jgi:hypothetical protein
LGNKIKSSEIEILNMSEIEINSETVPETENGYQITVVNIKYGKTFSKRVKERPEMVTLDVPDALLKMREKDNEKFLDSVEAFAYNTVTRKYGSEVSYCQVYLPLEG